MDQWRTWDLEEWNERLLRYFFSSSEESPNPIVVLLITADELAKAVNEPGEIADEVRDAFVAAVRNSIRRSSGLLEDAAGYPEWPRRPRAWTPPPFVAHLLFTCVAASESSDDLGDEASFISRLRELTDNQLPDHSLQMLPRLWEHLADWLAATPRKYRQLILPEAGSLTRIGYTVKLAFPDRRDQKQLSELLDRVGLMGHEPPVGRVLALVASQRARFRRPFLDACDEFKRLVATSQALATPRLLQHRFWAAVREAALRGRGQLTVSDARVRISLLAEEEEDGISVFAVSDERSDDIQIGFTELPVAYGSWRYALVPGSSVDATELDKASRAVLAGTLRLPRVSSHVEQGLVPFVVGPHGLLELAGSDQITEVVVALVRDRMAADLLRLFRLPATAARRSSYDGWVQLHNPKLHPVASEQLAGTSLDRTWILHQSLRPVLPRPVGGIRADDGWLGISEVLPRVVAPGSTAVALAENGRQVSLIPIGEDTWHIPPQDLAGEFTIVASRNDGESRGALRFYLTPAIEAFKPPAEPTAWIVEAASGTDTLASSAPFRASATSSDYEGFCERTAYLGADVGRFVTASDRAAWRVSRFAGRLFGSRGGARGDAAVPANQVDDPHARRRWRKMLFESAPWVDPEFDQHRRRIRPKASASAQLPRVEVEQSVPDLSVTEVPRPSEATDRLVRIVSGRASMRAGIDWREWSLLAQRVLGVDARMLEFVTRAWMEAGLLDVASSARWWHKAIFVRSPRFVAFTLGDCVGATLSGLALPTTIGEVRRKAETLGVFVEDRFSICPLVPSSLAFRAPNRQHLEDLSRTTRLGLHWLDLESFAQPGCSRHDGLTEAPQGYDRVIQWPCWSLKPGEYPGVCVEHRMRAGRPDYWVVSAADKRVWFYDLNLARAWAASLIGEPIVTPGNDSTLETAHAFLPLPLARVVSVLGGALPGPTGARYLYAAASLQLRQYVLDALARTFDVSRLAVSTAERVSR